MEKHTPQELCNAVYYAVTWSDVPLSRRQICDKVGLKKSPHMLKMIEYLVAGGFIGKCSGVDKHGRSLYLYFPPKKQPEGLPCQGVQ